MTPSAADRAPGVLAKRLLFVTGKGGVGKTTVAAALGVLAARAGRRTLVAEVARRQDVSRTLAGEHAPEMGAEIELAPGLFWTTIEPQGAMEEYLTDQLPVRALADLLIHSRAFTYFAAATPGLRELLTVGKVWELSQPQRRTPGGQPYDLVVVDAPATGHGMAYLAAPRTFADAARVGPIARQGRIIHQMLTDPRRTGVIAVSTPDDMPVSEALILHRELPRQMGIELERVVVNAVQPRRFSPKEARAIRERPRDRNPLALAAGQGRRKGPRTSREPHLSEQLGRTPYPLGATRPTPEHRRSFAPVAAGARPASPRASAERTRSG